MAAGFGVTKGVGTSDNITLARTSSPTILSMAGWLDFNAVTGSGRAIDSTSSATSMYATGSGTFFQRKWSGGTAFWLYTGPTLSTWQHWCFTYDGTLAATAPLFYLNGVLQTIVFGSPSTGTISPNTTAWHIGNDSTGAFTFNGMLAEMALWEGVLLTAGQAAALGASNASPLQFPAGLSFYVPLAGGTVIDYCNGSPTVTGTAYQPHPPGVPRGRARGRAVGPPTSAAAAPTFFQGSQPDYVRRVYSIANHPAYATRWNPVSDIVPTFAQAAGPERIPLASALRASLQLAVTSMPPSPERTIAQPFVAAPDRTDRARLTAERQSFVATEAPQPERTLALAAVSMPDAISRPTMHTSRQLAATSEPPAPERTAPVVTVELPERIDRGVVLTAHQFAAPPPPQPERTASLASTATPDRVEPRWRPELRDWAAFYPLPLAVAATPALSAEVYPDAARRPNYPVSAQQPWAGPTLPPAVPAGSEGAAPDRVTRPALLADRQQAWAAPTAPVAAAAPTFFAAAYPDVLARSAPTLLRTEAPRSLAPERTSPLASALAPDALPRRSRRPEHMQAFALAPAPERSAPLGIVEGPTRFPRPPTQHPPASMLPPAPEGRVPLDWQATYPEGSRGTGRRPSADQPVPPISPLDAAPMPWVSAPDVLRARPAPRLDFAPLVPQPSGAIPLFFHGNFPGVAIAPPRHASLYQLGIGLRLPAAPDPDPVLTIALGQESPTGTLLPLVVVRVLPAVVLTVEWASPILALRLSAPRREGRSG